MDILRFLLMALELVTCMLLITAILIQKTKTQGAGLAFGSSMGESLFGGQVSTVLTKITVVLAVIFLTNTAALTFISTKKANQRKLSVPAKTTAPARQPGMPSVPSAGQPGMPSVPDAAVPAPASEIPAATAPVSDAPLAVPPVQATPDAAQQPAK